MGGKCIDFTLDSTAWLYSGPTQLQPMSSLFILDVYDPTASSHFKVAFTLGQITPRKMVVCVLKIYIFITQMAKTTAYYAAQYALCECGLRIIYGRSRHSSL